MKEIINTNIDPTARFEICDSVIKNSAVKYTATGRVWDNSEIYLSTFKCGLFFVDHSNLSMVNITGGTLACRNAKIINCSSSGIVRIVDCEVSDSTLCDVGIIGIHCYYTVKPGKDIYVPTKFSDYEFNLKNGDLDITFKNPSKVWRFNKMSLAEFLEKYWKKVVGVTSKF